MIQINRDDSVGNASICQRSVLLAHSERILTPKLNQCSRNLYGYIVSAQGLSNDGSVRTCQPRHTRGSGSSRPSISSSLLASKPSSAKTSTQRRRSPPSWTLGTPMLRSTSASKAPSSGSPTPWAARPYSRGSSSPPRYQSRPGSSL